MGRCNRRISPKRRTCIEVQDKFLKVQHGSNAPVKLHYTVAQDVSREIHRISCPTMVLIHGVGLITSAFNCLQDAFVSKYKIISLDFLGSGASSKPSDKNEYLIPLAAQDLNTLLRKECAKNAVIVGHSIGAFLALQYAIDFANDEYGAAMIFTLGGSASFVQRPPSYNIGFPSSAVSALQNQAVNDYVGVATALNNLAYSESCSNPEQKCALENAKAITLQQGIAGTNSNGLIGMLQAVLDYDTTKTVGNITIPVVLIVGTKDETVFVSESLYLRNNIPNSSLVELSGIAHYCMVTDAKGVIDVISSYLSPNCACNVCASIMPFCPIRAC